MATRPLRTRRGPSTRRAFFAAQSMCTIASRISSWASSTGLPVSAWTSSASRMMYLVRYDFQASSRIRRSFQPSPDHHPAAARARATAWLTSSSPQTGKVATGSDVAGFSESKVLTVPAWAIRPRVVVAMAASTLLRAVRVAVVNGQSRREPVNHRLARRRYVLPGGGRSAWRRRPGPAGRLVSSHVTRQVSRQGGEAGGGGDGRAGIGPARRARQGSGRRGRRGGGRRGAGRRGAGRRGAGRCPGARSPGGRPALAGRGGRAVPALPAVEHRVLGRRRPRGRPRRGDSRRLLPGRRPAGPCRGGRAAPGARRGREPGRRHALLLAGAVPAAGLAAGLVRRADRGQRPAPGGDRLAGAAGVPARRRGRLAGAAGCDRGGGAGPGGTCPRRQRAPARRLAGRALPGPAGVAAQAGRRGCPALVSPARPRPDRRSGRAARGPAPGAGRRPRRPG